jgi:branched-chain amino acid transport system ATP-binding protein
VSFFQVEDLSIRFGGVAALANVSLEVEEGEIYGLIGPNGAGKTTLINCISGFFRPDEGYIRFRHKDISGRSAHEIAREGIARTFQNLELLPEMSVFDNILMGMHEHIQSNVFSEMFYLPKARKQEKKAQERTNELLEFLGLVHIKDELAVELPYGLRKLVEFGRALATQPRLLLLDEPAAGMNSEEIQEFAGFIQDIHKRLKLSILVVEHIMDLIMGISHRIGVLNFGIKIAEGTPSEIQSNEAVIEAYLGEE